MENEEEIAGVPEQEEADVQVESPGAKPVDAREYSMAEPVDEQPTGLEQGPSEEVAPEQPESTDTDLYTVQAADLNAYPELSQQGVQLYDEVKYGSLWVNKLTTVEGNGVTPEPWPRSIGQTRRGITFGEGHDNGQ